MDLIRGYGYLKTKNVPIVCYLTRSRRSNRILFFARDAFEEEGGGFYEEKERRRKKRKCRRKKQNSRKNARKIFVFEEKLLFSHQKLIRNRARRAPKWTKRNVNLNRNDTSGVSCSCWCFVSLQNSKTSSSAPFVETCFLSPTREGRRKYRVQTRVRSRGVK